MIKDPSQTFDNVANTVKMAFSEVAEQLLCKERRGGATQSINIPSSSAWVSLSHRPSMAALH